LEYFCAWEFVWQFKESQTLTVEQLINEVFGAHWQDESWHEVLRLICGMIEPKFVAEIIDFLLEQKVDRSDFLDEYERVTEEGLSNIILAANCFAEARNRNLIATTSEQSLEKLKGEIEQDSRPWFNFELMEILMSLIATNWKEDPHTLPWFKDIILQNENKYMDGNVYLRQAAVYAIAQGWKEDPDTLPWLKDRALQDEDEEVRYAAVYAIAEGWKEDPDTLPFLKYRALLDWNESVRGDVVYVIAEVWKADPNTLTFLKDLALQETKEYVQKAVVKAIAQNWKEDLHTLLWLKNRALQDENWDVREAVVTAIACCTNCLHYRHQRCWNTLSPLAGFRVAPESYCPVFESLPLLRLKRRP
jgi:hypothetical protein